MIRFETKKENAAEPAEKPKKPAKVAEPVQLSLDPDTPDEDAAAKPAKRKSSVRSK